MSVFTLDTSGAVHETQDNPPRFYPCPCTWPDLSPFEQGYVEAMFVSLATAPFTEHPHLQRDGVCYGETIVGFSDLAPETLAAIRKDCLFLLDFGAPNTVEAGRDAWERRQRGAMAVIKLLPLDFTLGDDGLVYQPEAAQ